jgi:hypothetical protein
MAGLETSLLSKSRFLEQDNFLYFTCFSIFNNIVVPLPPIVTTASKGTNGQDSTSLSISPLPGYEKLVYLGYNIRAGASTGTDLTGKSNTNAKSSTDKKDNDSTDKGNNSTKPSSHTNDSSKSKPSPKSKDHNDNEAGGSNKAKKSNSQGDKSHKGGDSFFGHDPFF